MPLLASVCILLVFFLVVFGIIALVTFRNTYHNVCVSIADGSYEDVTSLYAGSYGCGREAPARPCPAGYTCKARPLASHRCICCACTGAIRHYRAA